MEVEVVEVKPQLVLGVRERGHYKKIAELIPKACRYADSKGLKITGAPVFLCHEMTKEQAVKADSEGTADIEIAVPVSERREDEGDFRFYELPGGTMAKIVHKGPYDQCEPTYKRLFQWIHENGKKITGPLREVYANDPREVKPEEIETEIYAPIA